MSTNYVPTAEISMYQTWDIDGATTETTLPCSRCSVPLMVSESYSALDEWDCETGDIFCFECVKVAIGGAR